MVWRQSIQCHWSPAKIYRCQIPSGTIWLQSLNLHNSSNTSPHCHLSIYWGRLVHTCDSRLLSNMFQGGWGDKLRKFEKWMWHQAVQRVDILGASWGKKCQLAEGFPWASIIWPTKRSASHIKNWSIRRCKIRIALIDIRKIAHR